MKLRKKLFSVMLVLALLLLSAFVWSAGKQEAVEEAKVIKIGYTAPFTGGAAEFGTNGWRGVQLALEDIEKAGITINGEPHKIEIIRYDSICTPTEAVANVRKLALEDKVVAIIGDHCSSCCMAIAPLCDEFKIPGLTIECAADAVTSPGHDFYFRMRPCMGLMAPTLTPKIVKLYNPKTVGFMSVNDDYGRSFADNFEQTMAGAGVESVSKIFFERGTTDFMPFLSKIRGADPDMVFYCGNAAEGAMLMRQASEVGLTAEISFIGSEEMSEMEIFNLAGADALEGTYSVALWGSVPAELEKRVKDKFNAPMHYAILYGYDALIVMKNAIVAAQSLDPVKIRDALKKTDHEGLEGHIKFEDFENYRNQGRYTPSLIKWENGKRVAQ